jgi:tRNA pseudouridine32 synthase/23S rRNA pseudouridine746 synthase
MGEGLSYFAPQPAAEDLPLALPNPFSTSRPHAVACRAAALLEAELQRGDLIDAAQFEGVRCGKMFGVLVVVDATERVGYLRGFSGMVAGSWDVAGFVGPLFDLQRYDDVWPAGRAALAVFDRRLAALDDRIRRSQADPVSQTAERHALKQEQKALSHRLRDQLYAGYQIDSARGVRRSLRDLFPDGYPPGGAADCAAPKLLGHAYRCGLRPIALAEFWVGASPSPDGRGSGIYHAACQKKCGPVLAHMLDGLNVSSP